MMHPIRFISRPLGKVHEAISRNCSPLQSSIPTVTVSSCPFSLFLTATRLILSLFWMGQKRNKPLNSILHGLRSWVFTALSPSLVSEIENQGGLSWHLSCAALEEGYHKQSETILNLFNVPILEFFGPKRC